MLARLCLLPVALLSVLALTGADWTRFRGPNGTGIAADRDVPVEWTDRNILWKTALPGSGHSSPIVVKGKVYLLSATRKERLLVCLDAAKGKLLWSKAVPGQVGMTHHKSSLASATPCSDGERVYCVFWDGNHVGLYAYGLDGKRLWERDLGPFRSQHGQGFSPIVYGGKVIVNNDQDGKATLQAFHAKDGSPAWSVKRRAFRACYSTPFVLEQGTSAPELIVASTAGLTGYNPAGKEVWHYTWSFPVKPLRTVGSPVAGDGLVFLGSGDGDGSRAMIAVKLGGKGDVTRTHLAWEKDSGTPYVPCMLFYKHHLYTINDFGTVNCCAPRTGKELWRARLGRGTTVSASPVLIDGKVYAPDEKGDVFVYAARPEGYKLLARNKLGEPISSTPAVAGGRLYIRGSKHLFCIGKP
jgi:outer membrane protein assembly factor BamB